MVWYLQYLYFQIIWDVVRRLSETTAHCALAVTTHQNLHPSQPNPRISSLSHPSSDCRWTAWTVWGRDCSSLSGLMNHYVSQWDCCGCSDCCCCARPVRPNSRLSARYLHFCSEPVTLCDAWLGMWSSGTWRTCDLKHGFMFHATYLLLLCMSRTRNCHTLHILRV